MFAEDLSVFMNVAEFADVVVLDGVTVHGLFDNGYEETALGMGICGSAAMFTLASADVPENATGLELVIGENAQTTDAVSYTITETMPDGTGITRLRLRK